MLQSALMVVVLGYLVIGRTFGYLGLPQVNLFLGEILLLTCVALRPTRQRLLQAVRDLGEAGRWHVLSLGVVVVLVVGIYEALRGVSSGNDLLTALKNLPFNYYPLFLFIGIWWGTRDPDAMRRATLWLARGNAYYGTAFVLVLSKSTLQFPGQSDVPLFGNGNSSGLALLGLMVFHRSRSWETRLLLALNAFVLLGLQQRSEWLGFAAGLMVLCLLTHRMKNFLKGTVAVLGLLTVVSVLGITVPGAAGRGGEITLGGVVGRSVAAVAPNLASHYVKDTQVYSATAQWRTIWWGNIWHAANADPSTGVLGHGYGYELRLLGKNVPADTRTPHNAFFYALGYTGWLGVSSIAVLWGCLGRLLWQVWRTKREIFGILIGVFSLGLGMFGNWFETPYGALPTYLLIGLALSSLGRADAPAASEPVEQRTLSRAAPGRRRTPPRGVGAPARG